jgi:macrolide-specific efflux system membrane fusion protein
MFASYLAAMMVLAAPGGETVTPPPSQVRIKDCLVSLIDDVQLSAQEPGLLISLDVREGAQVKVGDLLGRINDDQAQAAQKVADGEYRGAREKADNDVNTRYATAARDYAQAELDANKDANKRAPGTKSFVELEKLRLAVVQAALQIEQSQHEQVIAKFEADARQAKLESATNDIARRKMLSPIHGEVVEVLFRVGEWVQPGDKVMRVVRLDRLRVEGFISAKDVLPGEVDKRPVTIEVELARGRRERFSGEVVYVNPLVQPGGDYRVRAEVENRMEANQWLLRPGTEAEMIITIGAAPRRN